MSTKDPNASVAFPALLAHLLPVTQTAMLRVTIGTVSLRDLHTFLVIPEPFSRWFQQIEDKLTLVPMQDFKAVDGPRLFNRPLTDYQAPIAVATRFVREGKLTDRAKQCLSYLDVCYHEDYERRNKRVIPTPSTGPNVGSDIIGREVLRSAKGHNVTVAVVAKRLGVGELRLFQFLRDHHILTRGSKYERNLPLQKYMDQGWFQVATRSYEHEGDPWIYGVTLVTPRGFQAIRETLDKLPRDQFEALR